MIYDLTNKLKNKFASIISPCVIKYYKNKECKALKNKDFSILCSNCIGGIIYNRLGMEFLSPTINMWETQHDFIKFAINPKYYVNQPLEFIETDEPTPVAKCGDILLHFNHHNNAADAERDWNRRKIRINYDNIYIILYYREGYTIEEIREIEKAKCKNIVVLTDRELPLDYAVVMKPNLERMHGDSFIDKDKYGITTFEKQWDFVEWLNSERRIDAKCK